MRTSDVKGPVIAIAIVMALIGSGVVYMIAMKDDEQNEEEPIEMGVLTQRLSSLTSATVADMGSSDIDDVRETIASLMNGWVDASRNLVSGYNLVMTSSDILVTSTDMTASLPLPPSAMETRTGLIKVNNEMFGDSGSMPLVPSLRTDVRLSLELTPIDGSGTRNAVISYSVMTVDMERALINLLRILEEDVNGWSSGLARDVEYMLNSLVRLRAKAGVGTTFTDTNFHLLNEGDVELALNFAFAIRLARWTGTIPLDLVTEIDRYFSTQNYATLMNPTGARNWGESEKENFQDYIERSRGETTRRRADDLLTILTSFRHADTADLFMRFLYMDRGKNSFGRMEPLDLTSPLKEDQVIDPRQPEENLDPYSLEHHPTFPESKGLEVYGSISSNGQDRFFEPEFSMDYLVSGRDLEISGINSFKAWYTNADLTLTDDDITNYGNSTSITRCGAIPPPPEPPSRDYRVQWDLVLKGSVPITVDSTGWAGNTYDPSSVTEVVEFEIPVRVHSGTGRLYDEGFPGLYNINTGTGFTTNISGGWVITPVANATEYFSDRVWPELKEAMSSVTSLARTSGWFENILEPVQARQTLHSSAIATIASLQPWMEDTDLQSKLHIIQKNMIEDPGIDPGDIGPIMLDGQSFSISYSPARDRMELISKLPEGSITLRVWPISGGRMNIEATVRTDSGTRIEMDLADSTFSIHGNFGGSEINEGSMIASPPEDSVWRMLGRSGMISSPTIILDAREILSPYLGDSNLASGNEGEVLLSVIMAGDDKYDDVMDDLRTISVDNILDLFRRVVPLAEDHGLSIGIKMSYSGESSPDLIRTAMFSSLTLDDLRRIERSNEVERIVTDMITSSRMPYPSTLGEEMVFTETTPAWTIQIPGVEFNEKVTTVFHVSAIGTTSYSYFTGDMYDGPADTWTVQEETNLSPLW
jgi:hypothetical protein